MTQPPGAQSGPQRTPLSAEEKARAEVNFSPYAARALLARGWFRVSADTPEMVELFQKARGQLRQRQGDRDHLGPRGAVRHPCSRGPGWD
jgi:hypothetical protein